MAFWRLCCNDERLVIPLECLCREVVWFAFPSLSDSVGFSVILFLFLLRQSSRFETI